MGKTTYEPEQKMGTEPLYAIVAREAGVDHGTVFEVLAALRKSGYTIAKQRVQWR